MPLITLDDVEYTVDNRLILSDITLSIERGKITTIIGPNGAGKTTLLRLILGLSSPSAGRIKKHVQTIGYMPQKLQLNPFLPLTVKRFLRLTQANSTKSLEEKIQTVLHEVGGCHLTDSRMSTLSGGELQRVMLARSLLLDPELLILDEPAQGVDIIGQADLYDLIARIRDHRGCGVVLVSHDLHLVMAASDTVICLNRHICCSGNPQLVQQDPRYLELFAKSPYLPQMILYPHHHDHHHDPHLEHHCAQDHSSLTKSDSSQ